MVHTRTMSTTTQEHTMSRDQHDQQNQQAEAILRAIHANLHIGRERHAVEGLQDNGFTAAKSTVKRLFKAGTIYMADPEDLTSFYLRETSSCDEALIERARADREAKRISVKRNALLTELDACAKRIASINAQLAAL